LPREDLIFPSFPQPQFTELQESRPDPQDYKEFEKVQQSLIEDGLKYAMIYGGGVSVQQLKIIVEKHPDGYVAYPLGLRGVVVGQGETYEEALQDVKSAIRFHIDTFGKEVFEIDPPILDAFVAETNFNQ
jgi:predicted RNase H-like HicB family nuclease